jgi:UDP-N-acetylglucosamine acyltransferase
VAINKTAIVDPAAQIHPTAEIGPGAVIEKGVVIGSNVKVMAYAHICNGTEIEEGTVIHMGAVIGHEPQDFSYKGQRSFTRIGKNTVIREYVTIHRGAQEGSATIVGDNNFIMVQCHLGHNCVTADNVIMANSALLAGHVEVGRNTFISGNVVFHQFCRIGEFAMIGGFTGVNKDVPPYMIVRGPSTVRGVNLVGLRRGGFGRESIKEIMDAYSIFFKSGLNTKDAITKIKETLHCSEAEEFVRFVESSKRGICKYRYDKEEYFE